MNPVLEQNRRAWDDRVGRGKWYVDTATPEDFQNPLAAADPGRWLGGQVSGKRLLCLAAGGGRHGPLFAAAGAIVTVVDLSPQMLALDRKIAAERTLALNLVEASMDDLSMLGEATFDIVVQPVSTCYVPDIAEVYGQVARVTAPGGIYLSQHKQPVSLQAEFDAALRGYVLREPCTRKGPLPAAPAESWHREAGTIEFLHRWEALLGALCRSGFVIEDVGEPPHADAQAEPGSFGHRSCYAPPYVTLKARRVTQSQDATLQRKLWTP
ncbi:MAG TPA: class I SAM-dependent methyltransferase [Verrucomicrobiae bacterium]|jgi:SAM-dependent methyltransferase